MRTNFLRWINLLKNSSRGLNDVHAVPTKTLSTSYFDFTLSTNDLAIDRALLVNLDVYVQLTCDVNPVDG